MTKDEVFDECQGDKLRSIYARAVAAADEQSESAEKYASGPYAEDVAKKLSATAQALRLLGDEIRAWHGFLRMSETPIGGSS